MAGVKKKKRKLKPFRPSKKDKKLKRIGRPPKKKKKINSRAKGKHGELEMANFLKDRGIEARRGQQFQGGGDSPDVIAVGCLAGIHLEVKRTETGNLYKWFDQACTDADVLKTPVVAHRKNGRQWLAIMDMRDFITIMEKIHEKEKQKVYTEILGQAMAKNLETIIDRGAEHAK